MIFDCECRPPSLVRTIFFGEDQMTDINLIPARAVDLDGLALPILRLLP